MTSGVLLVVGIEILVVTTSVIRVGKYRESESSRKEQVDCGKDVILMLHRI